MLMQAPTLILYNLALSSNVANGLFDEALSLFMSMMGNARVVPSDKTLQQVFAALQGKAFDQASLSGLAQL